MHGPLYELFQRNSHKNWTNASSVCLVYTDSPGKCRNPLSPSNGSPIRMCKSMEFAGCLIVAGQGLESSIQTTSKFKGLSHEPSVLLSLLASLAANTECFFIKLWITYLEFQTSACKTLKHHATPFNLSVQTLAFLAPHYQEHVTLPHPHLFAWLGFGRLGLVALGLRLRFGSLCLWKFPRRCRPS